MNLFRVRGRPGVLQQQCQVVYPLIREANRYFNQLSEAQPLFLLTRVPVGANNSPVRGPCPGAETRHPSIRRAVAVRGAERCQIRIRSV